MQITVTGEPKEIAALVLALQERQRDLAETVMTRIREKCEQGSTCRSTPRSLTR